MREERRRELRNLFNSMASGSNAIGSSIASLVCRKHPDITSDVTRLEVGKSKDQRNRVRLSQTSFCLKVRYDRTIDGLH